MINFKKYKNYFFVLTIIMALMLFANFSHQNLISLSNQEINLSPVGELTKSMILEQDLTLPDNFQGNFVRLQVKLATYARVNNDLLQVKLEQNNIKSEVLISTKDVKDNSYYDLQFKGKFLPGNVKLSIISTNGMPGKAITAWLTEDLTMGQAYLNGQKLNKSLVVNVMFIQTPSYVIWTIFLIFFLLIIHLLILIIWSKIFKKPINKGGILASFIILSVISIRFPSLSTSSEVWAETGTNFFYNAFYRNFNSNVWILDAGYLPWLQRLTSLVVIKMLGVTIQFPIVLQFVGFVFIVLISVAINSKDFRILISNDWIRFFISIVLGCGLLAGYEEFTFINFSYFGVIFCLLLMFKNIEKMSNTRLIIYILFIFLLMASKAYYVVFVPIYFILFIFYVLQKKIKSIMIYSAALIAGCIQLFVIFQNRQSWSGDSSIINQLPTLVKKIITFYLQSYHWILFKTNLVTLHINYFIIGIIIFIFFSIAYRLSQKSENKIVFYSFVVCNLLAIASIALNTITLPYLKEILPWSEQVLIVKSRHWFFSNVLIFIGIMILIGNVFKNKAISISRGINIDLALVITVCFFLTTFIIMDKPNPDYYENKELSYSQWNSYSNLLKKDSYSIPINPYPWMLLRNEQVLFGPAEAKDLTSEINLSTDIPNGQSFLISGVSIERDNRYYYNNNFVIKAYDSNNKEIASVNQISPKHNKYIYFIFNESIKPYKVKLFTEDMNPVNLKTRWILTGKLLN